MAPTSEATTSATVEDLESFVPLLDCSREGTPCCITRGGTRGVGAMKLRPCAQPEACLSLVRAAGAGESTRPEAAERASARVLDCEMPTADGRPMSATRGGHACASAGTGRISIKVVVTSVVVTSMIGLCTLALAWIWRRDGDVVQWHELSPLPEPLGLGGAFAGVSGGALIVAGGANFPGAPPWEGGVKHWDDQIYALAAPQGSWARAGRLHRPLAYGVSASWQGRLLCVGGSDAARHYAETFALRYRPDSNSVQIDNGPALPSALANAAGVLVGNTLYVAGGSTTPQACCD